MWWNMNNHQDSHTDGSSCAYVVLRTHCSRGSAVLHPSIWHYAKRRALRRHCAGQSIFCKTRANIRIQFVILRTMRACARRHCTTFMLNMGVRMLILPLACLKHERDKPGYMSKRKAAMRILRPEHLALVRGACILARMVELHWSRLSTDRVHVADPT